MSATPAPSFAGNQFGELAVKTVSSKQPGPKYIPKREKIAYYGFDDANMTADKRAWFIATTARVVETKILSPSNTAAWIYSLLDAAYPGLVAKIFSGTGITLDEQALSVANEAFIETGVGQSPTLVGEPDWDKDLVEDATLEEMVHVVATLIYAIGKKPTAANITAFNVNRSKAWMQKNGKAPDEVSWVADSTRMPQLAAYSTVYGYFSPRHAERRAVVTELTAWTTIDGDAGTDAMASVIKLWEDSGLTHVDLIKELLLSYGDVAVDIPALRTESIKFLGAVRDSVRNSSSLQGFEKVLVGDRMKFLQSREFPELLKVAKEIATRLDDRFGNYAPDLGKSTLWAEFERVAQSKGIILPPARSGNTGTV